MESLIFLAIDDITQTGMFGIPMIAQTVIIYSALAIVILWFLMKMVGFAK